MCIPLTVKPNKYFLVSDLIGFLESSGVETRPLVTGNLCRHSASTIFDFLRPDYKLPGSDYIHENSFYIGLSPVLADNDLDRLCSIFENFLLKYS